MFSVQVDSGTHRLCTARRINFCDNLAAKVAENSTLILQPQPRQILAHHCPRCPSQARIKQQHCRFIAAYEEEAVNAATREQQRRNLSLSGELKSAMCSNLCVPWFGGHQIAREVFSVEDLSVHPGMMYTGEVLCTHRKGPDRSGEYQCMKCHKLHGMGSLTLPCGDVYTGKFRNDKFAASYPEGKVEYAHGGGSFTGTFQASV